MPSPVLSRTANLVRAILQAFAAAALAMRQKVCRHEFELYQVMRVEDGLVTWPCCKCNRTFRATHGLAILHKHGRLRPQEPDK